MSAFVKTPAIVLRHTPVANTSRVVTWLTPHHGRLSTMIKGAFRPRSAFLGQFDTFYTCELVYYDHAGKELLTARECAPLKSRIRLRTDWRACAAASYVTDLISRISASHPPQDSLFGLLDQALDHLAEHGASFVYLSWLELRLLDTLGLSPRLTHCMRCQCQLTQRPGPVYFIHERGGLLCPACGRSDAPSALPVAPDLLAILRAWQQAETPSAAGRVRCSESQRKRLHHLLGAFLRHHLDMPLSSRELAFHMLSRSFPNTPLPRDNA